MVVDGLVFGARFRHPSGGPRRPRYLEWFKAHGFDGPRDPPRVDEGEGDLLAGDAIVLAGTGFRTDPAAHAEAPEFFGVPVVTLRLVDPRFYHLDTALAVLDEPTTSPTTRRRSRRAAGGAAQLYPDAVIADAADAAVLRAERGLRRPERRVAAQADRGWRAELADRGYQPIGVDLSELRKAGGGTEVLHAGDRAR